MEPDGDAAVGGVVSTLSGSEADAAVQIHQTSQAELVRRVNADTQATLADIWEAATRV